MENKNTEQAQPEKSKIKALNPILLLVIIIVLCAIASYIVPAGEYTRYLDEATGREIVDPNSFTTRYNIHKLVYMEETQDVRVAIAREKQIKGWSRRKKNALVESLNPEWKDLLPAADSDPWGRETDSSLRSE